MFDTTIDNPVSSKKAIRERYTSHEEVFGSILKRIPSPVDFSITGFYIWIKMSLFDPELGTEEPEFMPIAVLNESFGDTTKDANVPS